MDKNKKDNIHLDELISNLNELSEEMLISRDSSTDIIKKGSNKEKDSKTKE